MQTNFIFNFITYLQYLIKNYLKKFHKRGIKLINILYNIIFIKKKMSFFDVIKSEIRSFIVGVRPDTCCWWEPVESATGEYLECAEEHPLLFSRLRWRLSGVRIYRVLIRWQRSTGAKPWGSGPPQEEATCSRGLQVGRHLRSRLEDIRKTNGEFRKSAHSGAGGSP